MPQDQAQNDRIVWIWDLETRKIPAASPAAMEIWGCDSLPELTMRMFPPNHTLTIIAAQADAELDETQPFIEITCDLAGRKGLQIRIDRPAGRHLLRFYIRTPEPSPGPDPVDPKAAFDAAPVAMSILDSQGNVLKDNDAASALFGARAARRWQSRHVSRDAQNAGRALTHARQHGGDSYTASLSSPSAQRRMTISLSRLAPGSNGEPQFLATAMPILEDEIQAFSGNAAEIALQSAPEGVAVFSLETSAMLYANHVAAEIADAFKGPIAPETTLQTIFPADAESLREARNEMIIDPLRRVRPLTLTHPEQAAGPKLNVRATIGLWREEMALFLWIDSAEPAAAAPPPTDGAAAPGPAPQPSAPAQPPEDAPEVRRDANDANDANTANRDSLRRIERAGLIARASHALRTSVTSARGFAELLLQQRQPAEQQRESLGAILDATDELRATLETFLATLSEIEQEHDP
ncbi:MAG: hypothetical protein MRY74_09090 [Neomegalonema sp.]|nr:hypothetical protein [Neomegalonema sp.]